MNFSSLYKQEWIKLQSTRSLIFLFACLAVNVGISLLTFGILHLPPDEGKLTEEMVVNMNPFGVLMAGFSGTLAMIASLFFIMQYGDEYKYGLIRKNIIDGMGRRDIFNGKMLFLFGSYLMWTLLFMVVFLICGAIKLKGDFGFLLNSIQPEQIVKYYLHVIFYGAFAFFLVSLTRSATVSIIIFLGMQVVEQLAKPALMYFELPKVVPYLPIELATTIRASDIIETGQLIAYLVYLGALIGTGQLAIYKRDL